SAETPSNTDQVSRSLTGTSVLTYHMSKPSDGSDATIGRTSTPVTDGVNGTPRTGKETRPRSMSVVYIMRIK
ncbi:hypothetical protein LLH03_12370, partial [bacterium]|nr:hypothetical protein [bacterium]